MVYLLAEKKTLTAKWLAAYFEVSPRTIMRDVDALCAAGIPLYAKAGRGGGISLLKGHVLNNAVLTAAEQEQILLAVQNLAAVQGSAAPTLQKLQLLFQKTGPEWLEIDFTRWGNTEEDGKKFEMLKNAVLAKTVLTFKYFGANGKTTQKEVCPQKLLFKQNAWYLQGAALPNLAGRTYKINRISNLKTVPKSICLWPNAIAPEEPAPNGSENLLQFHVIFEKEVAHRLYDEFTADEITPLQNGSFSVRAARPFDNWLCGYLLSFGHFATVQCPANLRSAVATLAAKTAALYQV